MSVFYFVLLVGVLIFVHELGHFAWAKLFGVKVLTFSLGFGPSLLSVTRGETEYRVALFPFGGYVRMLGESPGDRVRRDELARAFGSQPLLRRMVIVIAGPLMNLVFPVVLFFFVALVSPADLTPPVVGSIQPAMPADGVLLPGDRILSVDGREVGTFEEIAQIVRRHPDEAIVFELERRVRTSADRPEWVRLAEVLIPVQANRPRIPELGVQEQVGLVGIRPTEGLPIVGVTSPNTDAARAGIQTFDRVIGIGGTPVRRFLDLHAPLLTLSMTPVALLRPTSVPGALGGLVDLDVYETHFTSVVPSRGRGDPAHRLGLEPASLYVSYVDQGAPEARMGLSSGDRLLSIDGNALRTFEQLVDALRAAPDQPHSLTWRRGDRLHEGRLVLRREHGIGQYGERYARTAIGMQPWLPASLSPAVAPPSRIGHAVIHAVTETLRMAELTVYSGLRLLQGKLTLRSIGGPISIYAETGRAAREGGGDYMRLMAFISVSLGLLNLLPIPTLDGGHLLFFLIEAVSRRPIPRLVRERAALVGLFVLICMMLLAIKNDIDRFQNTEDPRITVAE